MRSTKNPKIEWIVRSAERNGNDVIDLNPTSAFASVTCSWVDKFTSSFGFSEDSISKRGSDWLSLTKVFLRRDFRRRSDFVFGNVIG
jgi:hypothetical protein